MYSASPVGGSGGAVVSGGVAVSGGAAVAEPPASGSRKPHAARRAAAGMAADVAAGIFSVSFQ